jgi:hypothetical protein
VLINEKRYDHMGLVGDDGVTTRKATPVGVSRGRSGCLRGKEYPRTTTTGCSDPRRIGGSCVQNGSVMSGRAPADQGLFFGVALVVGAVMSSASHEGSSVNSFLPMAIRGELSFPQGIPC